MAKLRRDTTRFAFMRKYGLESENDLFQIEVDALQPIEPERFKDMVFGCVDEFFDEKIYEQNLKRAPTRLQILRKAEAQNSEIAGTPRKTVGKRESVAP